MVFFAMPPLWPTYLGPNLNMLHTHSVPFLHLLQNADTVNNISNPNKPTILTTLLLPLTTAQLLH